MIEKGNNSFIDSERFEDFIKENLSILPEIICNLKHDFQVRDTLSPSKENSVPTGETHEISRIQKEIKLISRIAKALFLVPNLKQFVLFLFQTKHSDITAIIATTAAAACSSGEWNTLKTGESNTLKKGVAKSSSSNAGHNVMSDDEPAAAKTIIQSIYICLKVALKDFMEIFELALLMPFLKSNDSIVRYYAALSVSLVTGMSDAEQRKLTLDIFNNQDDEIEAKSQFLNDFDRLERLRANIFNDSDKNQGISLSAGALKHTVNMSGVLVPHQVMFDHRISAIVETVPKFIVTKSSENVIHELALALTCDLPILLEGLSGVGKTSLIEEAAQMVGAQELLKIHLGDQTDSKLLLGTYMTTSTPGEFKWQPGVLTTAVTEGRWIIFEDIDLAPVDVIAVLLPLLETRWLHIPSRGERLRAKEGFKIIATRKAAKPSDVAIVGENLWIKLFLPQLDSSELLEILTKRFPKIPHLLSGMLEVYNTVLSNFPLTNGRQISIRDLVKWCDRISKNPQSQTSAGVDITELLFREAYDCFVAMISQSNDRAVLSKHIGNVIGISEHRIEYYLFHHIPAINADGAYTQFGRAILSIKSAGTDLQSSPFATTSTSLRHMEKIGVAIEKNEPVLLVGETGTGKTTVVQRVASQLGHKLTVMNMSQQSDSTDLLGGFKPVDVTILVAPVKEMFDRLFSSTFSVKQNAAFLDTIKKTLVRKKWNQLIVGFRNACQMAKKVAEHQKAARSGSSDSKPSKIRKMLDESLFIEWESFELMVDQFKAQVHQIQTNFLFSFVEGSLVKALKNGDWILLDEINLATAETLECLSTILQDSTGSILLLERGDTVPIKRHPDFRLFACMNPANDAGKRNLPVGLRSRFTELWIDAPDSHLPDLMLIIKSYIFRYLPPGPSGDEMCMDVAVFYNSVTEMSRNHSLFDGADQKVHVSMRTLTRALSCAGSIAPIYGIRRSLYEGCFMTFMTGLGDKSFKVIKDLLYDHILNGVKKPHVFINQIMNCPSDDPSLYTLIETYWIKKGIFPVPDDLDSSFVLTPSVESNLRNLARGCISRKYPILIQGPTSAGKTSIIEYLAKRTGHRFIRINNHEHTDLQEYLGGYMSNDEGALVFQEGVLVEALRKGYWIVLDELNLAPSDVLEALNRLLDDNRELFLAEKQEVIKPHPHFMLFATQNPAGQYGGRKQLSRAFRNRFLELHFTDIPDNELETILEKRCLIAPSYAKKCVSVYKKLSKSRDASRIFDGRQSFITLRDLFRWGLRRADSYEQLAKDGYMLISERVRKDNDRKIIQEILQKELRVQLDVDSLYSIQFESIISRLDGKSFTSDIVWTEAMKKLFVLIYNAATHLEPILLIGETGCGKTTVCQVLAKIFDQKLHIVNAHQNSETSDFLGSQRPARKREEYELQLRDMLKSFMESSSEIEISSIPLKGLEKIIQDLKKTESPQRIAPLEALLQKSQALFEWTDGPLVTAMQTGNWFLLDEISLADDSVLERLNSVLEPSRQLTLVEKSGVNVSEIKAVESFRFFATMNPGGDYGKKELSPALRNRFTEVWVSSVVSKRNDLLLILKGKLCVLENLASFWAEKILDYIEWLAQSLGKVMADIVSLRDVLAWCDFIVLSFKEIGCDQAYLHGGCMVLIDGMGANPLLGATSDKNLVMKARGKLLEYSGASFDGTLSDGHQIVINENSFGTSPFFIPFGPMKAQANIKFSLNAPTALQNCLRVLRSMRFSKPILLEGSPGAGKTSLITSIAGIGRYELIRINLSEQTDLMDLFGSDLPVEGGAAGEFSWRDGPFLKAMQEGRWVLLDELNLASQQVLEGLNACLDHRATVYIPELDRSFACHPNFRVFAAQNPQSQGGGRKGLPKSFVNRFTVVNVEELTTDDMIIICKQLYPHIDSNTIVKMISFNQELKKETMDLRSFAWQGSPWEFNLRDVLRWMELISNSKYPSIPSDFLETLYVERMRTEEDRIEVRKLFKKIFPDHVSKPLSSYSLTPDYFSIENISVKRGSHRGLDKHSVPIEHLQILPSSLPILKSLLLAVESKAPVLLVGPSASGKSSLIRVLAHIMGTRLREFSLNPGVDALELLGGFEQVDLIRKKQELIRTLEPIIQKIIRICILQNDEENATGLVNFLKNLPHRNDFSDCLIMIQPFAQELELNNFQEKLDEFNSLTNESRGKFEWVDSILISAMTSGDWILIDNLNLCSSSVLDRLNSLLEIDGSLAINERGLVNGDIQIIRPHPNFRIFMAMDPKYGEVSRAMRNRAVEICITSPILNGSSNLIDNLNILTSLGICGGNIPKPAVISSARSVVDIKVIAAKLSRGYSLSNLIALPVPFDNCYPYTQWPDRVTGFDKIKDSLFSNTQQDASIMFHGLMNKEMILGASQSNNNLLSSNDCILDTAAERFFSSFSLADLTNRRAWVKYASQFDNQGLLARMESVYFNFNCNRDIFNEIQGLRNKILSEMNLSNQESYLPLDLRFSSLSFSHAENYEKLNFLFDTISLRRKANLLKNKIELIQRNTTYINIATLNMAQMVLGISLKKMRVASLPHPSLQYFSELFSLGLDCLAKWNNELLLGQTFFGLLNDLLFSLEVKSFSASNTIVLVKRLLKTVGSESSSPLYCIHGVCKKLADVLCMDSILSCNTLWKNSNVITLVKPELFLLGQNLLKVDQMFNVWKMNPKDWFYESTTDSNQIEMFKMLIQGVSTLHFLNNQPEMDSNLFKAIETLPQKLVEAVEKRSRKEERPSLEVVHKVQDQSSNFLLWPVLDIQCLIQAIDMLRMIFGNNYNLSQEFQQKASHFLTYMGKTSFPPLFFEPIQRLLWYYDSQNSAVSVMFVQSAVEKFVYNWFQSIWNNGFVFWNSNVYRQEMSSFIHGAFAPVMFGEVQVEKMKAVENCVIPTMTGQSSVILSIGKAMHDVPLYAVSSKLNQLELLRARLSERDFSLLQIQDFDNCMIAHTIEKHLKCCDLPIQSISLNSLTDFEALKALLSECTADDGLISLLDRFKHVQTFKDDNVQRGLLWIESSLYTIQKLIPDFGVDPVETRKSKLLFLSRKLDTIAAEILVDSEYQMFTTGHHHVPSNDGHFRDLEDLKKKELKWNFLLPLRPAVSQMKEFFSELSHLKSQILHKNKIDSIISTQLSEINSVENTVVALQETLSVISERLATKYSFYQDLIEPICTAILQLKYGLNILNQSHESKTLQAEKMLKELLQYHSLDIGGIKSIARSTDSMQLSNNMKLDIFMVLLKKLRVLSQSSIVSRTELFDCSSHIFQAVAELWSRAEKERLEKLEESQSIYKTREHVIKTEDEMDQEQFYDLFPDYESDFIDIGDGAPLVEISNPPAIFDAKSSDQITQIFHEISSIDESVSLSKVWADTYDTAFGAASKLSEAKKLSPSIAMDEVGQPGLLYICQKRVLEAQKSDFSDTVYDFYNDSNIAQAILTHSVLISFSKALQKPLAQWPENAVLLGLEEICKKIISFPASSPLIRFLTGLEYLLIKSDDWERYSSKEYSLKKELDDIITLIIKWRKFELDTWRDLLAVEARNCKENASSQWFHLWKVIGDSAFMKIDQNDSFLRELLDILNQYCLSSKLGEYRHRLKILKSFKNYLTLSKSNHVVKHIVSNVCAFFEQFSESIEEKMETIKGPILKELREYVQIASWKDVNVFALKESAKRTHHSLNKIIKKFRLALQSPIKDIIATYHENLPVAPKSGESLQVVLDRFFPADFQSNTSIIFDQAIQIPGRLAQAPLLFEKSKMFASNSMEHSCLITSTVQIDEFSDEILSRIQDFQSQKPNSNDSGLKGQKMIRKKAWVDLLKHLSLIGLSPRCSQKYISNQDIVYMNSHAVIELDAFQKLPEVNLMIRKASLYYYKNVARLELIRKLTASHSKDISTLEIEKSVSYLDHLMDISISHRYFLESIYRSVSFLDATRKQMEEFLMDSKSERAHSYSHKDYFQIVQSSILKLFLTFEQTDLVVKSISTNFDTSAFSNFKLRVSNMKTVFMKIHSDFSMDSTEFKNWLPNDIFLTAIENGISLVADIYNYFSDSITSKKLGKHSFIFKELTSKIQDIHHELTTLPLLSLENNLDSEVIEAGESLLEKVMIVIQVFQLNGTQEKDDKEDGDYSLKTAHDFVQSPWTSNALPILINAIENLFGKGICHSRSISREIFQRLYPIFDQALRLVHYRIFELAVFHKTTTKLSYILSNTFYSVIKDGFCVPEPTEEGEEEEGQEDDNVDGMGIGEGEGQKDVSDEIENQDQAEGLKNDEEKAPDSNSHVKDEENGLEMDNDFDGTLEDVDADEDDEQQSNSDEKDENELDEQMGGLDDLADVVDEKLWGDEDSKDDNEKTEKDAPVSGGGESETVAQEQESSTDDKKDDSAKEKKPNSEKNPESDEPEIDSKEEDGTINEDAPENFEDSHGVDVQQADEMQEDLNFSDEEDSADDLPDDMQLDGGDDDTKNEKDDGFEDDTKSEEEESSQPTNKEPMKDDTLSEDGEENPLSEKEGNPNNQEEEVDDKQSETSDTHEDEQQPAHGFGEAEPIPEEEPQAEESTAMKDQNESTAENSLQPLGTEGESGSQMVQQESEMLGQGGSSMQNDFEEKEAQEDGMINHSPSNETLENSQSRDSAATETNPHRSVGNATEAWLSRLRNIADRIEESDKPQPSKELSEEDTENKMDFEFVKEEDEDQGNAQALGAADNNQLEKMGDKGVMEEDETMVEDIEEMDLDDVATDVKAPEANQVENQQEKSSNHSRENMQMNTKKEVNDVSDNEDGLAEDKVEEEQEETERIEGENLMFTKNEEVNYEVQDSAHEMEIDQVVDYDQLRLELEQRMAKWRLEGQNNHNANQELWRKYSNLTRDYSFHLCEQLRLILEPTLCTKLKGDFRTGKRLNMRKIIPYIASQFKKDKIWLRRTKPSKRSYQIMLAIDDSLSMASSKSVQLAFESLALISNALNQLEVGEVGVISFGEEVKLLHPFEQSWSDDAGAKVFSSFTFSQERTRVRLLIEQSLEILNHSRSLSQNSDLWQLQIIISDGICEDHEYIKSRVRSAAEDRIAMVFIILDTRSDQDSILTMSSVNYEEDPLTGMPVLKMNRYMDTFPFDFFVVVRNVEKLPDVLGDVVRQFLSLFSN